MRVRLTRVSGGTALRTDTVEGIAESPPTPGQPFTVIAPGLEFGTRVVSTSPVLDVECAAYCFQTESGSVYRVDILEEPS